MQLLKRGAMTAPAGHQAKAFLNRARGLLRMELEAPTRKNLHINFLAGLNAQVCQKLLAQGQLPLLVTVRLVVVNTLARSAAEEVAALAVWRGDAEGAQLGSSGRSAIFLKQRDHISNSLCVALGGVELVPELVPELDKIALSLALISSSCLISCSIA